MHIRKLWIITLLVSVFLLVGCEKQIPIDETIVLPDLTGFNQEQVVDLLDTFDLNYTFEFLIDNNVRPGRFYAYGGDLEAGMVLEPGMSITIYFVEKANTLPNLSGLNQNEIMEALNLIDVTYSFEYVQTSTITPGLFFAYANSLQAGDIVDLGSNVVVKLAEAIDERIELPNLTSLKELEIKVTMDSIGIDYAFEEVINNDVIEGLFLGYESPYQAGDLINPNQPITIYIAVHANILPELEGLNQQQILTKLSKIDIIVEIQTILTNDIEQGLFVSYGRNRYVGEIVPTDTLIIVYIAERIIEVNRNLMISGYLEGSLFNRAIELYNPSETIVDLSEFHLGQFLDGQEVSSYPIELSGYLAPGETYVIAHENSTFELMYKADLVTNELMFNGNDAIALMYYNDVIVDVIGNIGWGLVYLQDQTIIRKSSIVEPSETFSILDWDIYAKDYIDGLGSHPQTYPTSFTFDSAYLSIPFSEPGGMVQVTFVSNNDGDTAQFLPGFTYDNRVRFIGIDTPETGSGIVATEARQFVYNRLSQAQTIYLQHDPHSGNIDTYERYLALIWADGVLLNYELVLRGFSQNNYQDPEQHLIFNNVSLTRWMVNAEQYAKDHQLGVWA